MESRDLLKDGYSRIGELVQVSVKGLGSEGLSYRPEPGANSIAWLVWHLTRIQDDHVSEIAGLEQAVLRRNGRRRGSVLDGRPWWRGNVLGIVDNEQCLGFLFFRGHGKQRTTRVPVARGM